MAMVAECGCLCQPTGSGGLCARACVMLEYVEDVTRAGGSVSELRYLGRGNGITGQRVFLRARMLMFGIGITGKRAPAITSSGEGEIGKGEWTSRLYELRHPTGEEKEGVSGSGRWTPGR